MLGFEHHRAIHKFGLNDDADSGDDIWQGSSAYPFPAAAATTTIQSSSAADTNGGTGAHRVTVQGLDADYEFAEEEVLLNGATPVALPTQFLRVHRAFVTLVGSGGVNAGTISIKHGATDLAIIGIGYGQTLMSIFTLSRNEWGWLKQWRASTTGTGATAAQLAFQARKFGESWRTQDLLLLDSSGNSAQVVDFVTFIKYPPKTDFRIRAVLGSSGIACASQFSMIIANGRS